MRSARLSRRHRSRITASSRSDDQKKPDVDEVLEENARLREENTQLRERVAELVETAIKNIVDPAKHGE